MAWFSKYPLKKKSFSGVKSCQECSKVFVSSGYQIFDNSLNHGWLCCDCGVRS